MQHWKTTTLIGALSVLTACGAASTALDSATDASASANTNVVTGTLPTAAEANLAAGASTSKSVQPRGQQQEQHGGQSQQVGQPPPPRQGQNGTQSNTTSNTRADASLCAADTVIATDTSGDTVTADVASDCSFSIALDIDESYVVSFTKDDGFIATLVFGSGISGGSSSLFPKGASASGINLGSIVISGTTAAPSNNPLAQHDCDHDGQHDLADADDDNNGIYDDEEPDCDVNGVPDSLQRHVTCATPDRSVNRAEILAVKPVAWMGHRVDLQKTVKLLASCRIDPASVTAASFAVVSRDGNHAVACEYAYGFWRQKTYGNVQRSVPPRSIVKCVHREDPFVADSEYRAEISGLRCLNGRLVERMRWSWTTEADDYSAGCFEDDLEEATELTEEEATADSAETETTSTESTESAEATETATAAEDNSDDEDDEASATETASDDDGNDANDDE